MKIMKNKFMYIWEKSSFWYLFCLWGKRLEEEAASICQNAFTFSNLNKTWDVKQFSFSIYREY